MKMTTKLDPLEDPLKIFGLKRKSIPKIAVLAAGLAVAMMAATISPQVAQAFPNKQQECLNCHGPGIVGGTVNAVPSTTTPAAGATYTVLVTEPLNTDEPAGDTGYWIANSTAAGVTGTTTGVYGGYDGSGAATRTATMTAPAAAGTYYYKVWAVKGSTAPTGVTNFKVYSITVAGAPVVVTTTTALAVSPASPVLAPASPTLKATVTGTGAAGTVEFFNGATSLGTPTAISGGVASETLSGIAAGTYSYTAVFTPTDAAAFTSSTSAVSTYVVNVAPPVVVTTSTALAVTPASPVVAPASPTLTATVTGAGAVGSVEFFNGTTSLGTSPVASGLAAKSLVGVVAGSYSYKAVFTPTDAAAFTSSTSAVSTYVVNVAPPVVVTTTTALAVTPASPVVAPASPTLTATVSGAGAAGTVEFFNGTTSLGNPIAVSAGVVTKALVGVVAGSYSYTAVFTPTDAALFTSSTSGNVALTVTVAAPVQVTTTTALAVTPVTPVVAMGNPTLTATVTGLNAAGTVEFFEGTTSLGTPTAIAGGLAAKTLSGLAAGSYSYTAVFTPTSAAAFTSSTSAASTYVVTSATPSSATITWMWRTHGVVGSYVLIRGTGFGTAGSVSFGSVPATVAFWNASTIVVKVPAGNIVGANVPVTVTPIGGTASNSVMFQMDSGWVWGHDGDDD